LESLKLYIEVHLVPRLRIRRFLSRLYLYISGLAQNPFSNISTHFTVAKLQRLI